MLRVHRPLGAQLVALLIALLFGALVPGSGPAVAAQDAADADLRARLAAITLDERALPEGMAFGGETFLTAEQSASGDLDAAALTDAGFVTQYLSVYSDSADELRVRTYASAWTDAAAAEAGFGIIEDEARTNPDADLADGDASVGEEPRETTTGTYPDPADDAVTVSSVDVTFRVDRFLVGVAVETTTGEEPDAELASTLAADLEGRATGVVGDQSPEGSDLALVPQVLPLQTVGTELQAGFLSPAEVETIYGLQGSALGSFAASWAQAIGLGEGDDPAPFVAVGLTTFAAGTSVGVVDVQGAPSVEVAQQAATELATAQVACIGQQSCAAPELPRELTGQ